MKSIHRMAQLVAVFGTAMFICAVPAIAQDCPGLTGWWQGGSATTVAAAGMYAYIGDDAGIFRIIDTSNPSAPQLVGEMSPEPNAVLDIAVSGDYAYMVAAARLTVIDVSNPSAPSRVGFTVLYGAAGVAVDGDYAYVSSIAFDHLTVVDISDPNSPTQVGYLFIDGFERGTEVAVAGGFAYLPIGPPAGPGHTLYVADVTDPRDPFVAGDVWHGFNLGDGLALDGHGYAYVTCRGPGPLVGFPALTIYDVRDSEHPEDISWLNLGDGWAHEIAVSRSYAYIAVWDDLLVIDVMDPGSPLEEGFYDTQGLEPESIAIAGGYVYVTVRDAGLMIFRECAVFFTDSFESGDTSAWSATVP